MAAQERLVGCSKKPGALHPSVASDLLGDLFQSLTGISHRMTGDNLPCHFERKIFMFRDLEAGFEPA